MSSPLRTLAGWLMTSARQAEKPSRETVIAFLTRLRSGHVPETADKEPV